MLRTLFSFRGLVLVFGLIAVVLPIALVLQLRIVRNLNALNEEVAQTRQGALATAAVLRYQLDEENSIRGYAATGSRDFLDPYDRARFTMPAWLSELAAALPPEAANGREGRALRDLERVNDEWVRTVADPILAGSRRKEALLRRGKALIERFRADLDPLDMYFSTRYRAAVERRDMTIRTTAFVTVIAIGAIGAELIVFGSLLVRMRRELDRERGFVETLQSAASVRLVPPPHLAVGTAYRSATRGTRIGGDVYDVYRLDADRTLIVIGDVSGKGLGAAVDTTFVRYAVRTLATEGLAPDEIVSRFDALYHDAKPPAEAFVSVFVGLHDRRDGMLTYANAGHEACWVRRGRHAVLLEPTGPIIGIGGLPFYDARTPLPEGDMLVLATDGLTEARDPQGNFLPIERLTDWIGGLDVRTPPELVDRLLALVTRYARGRISDDLAILAVEPLP